MEINNKIIEFVTAELVGPDAVPVLLYLKGKKNISEFTVAKDLDVDIHAIRSVLYRLYEHSLASFVRRKDKKKGWYVCYWDFKGDKISYLYNKIKLGKIEKLEERLDKENENEFYMCRNACSRMDFDKAFGMNFKCPECGSIMNPLDNKRTIEFLKEKIEDLKKEMISA